MRLYKSVETLSAIFVIQKKCKSMIDLPTQWYSTDGTRVKAILDANRNSLMLLDLKFSIGTLGIGSGAFVASLYGMNLKNFIEESDLGFWGVSASSFVFAAIVCSYGLSKLRRVQRVSMWGEHGGKNRGNWRHIDLAPPLPGESRADRIRRINEKRLDAIRGRYGPDTDRLEALPPALRQKRR